MTARISPQDLGYRIFAAVVDSEYDGLTRDKVCEQEGITRAQFERGKAWFYKEHGDLMVVVDGDTYKADGYVRDDEFFYWAVNRLNDSASRLTTESNRISAAGVRKLLPRGDRRAIEKNMGRLIEDINETVDLLGSVG